MTARPNPQERLSELLDSEAFKVADFHPWYELHMAAISTDLNELHELRARLAALESTVAALQPVAAIPAISANPSDPDVQFRPTRRLWLGLLATAGFGSALDAAPPTGANQEWKTYSPKLMGEKKNPTLGDGVDPKNAWMKSGQNGHYWQFGRTVIVKTWHQFSIGADPGLGHYRLSLPVQAALGSDAWLGPTGVALMHSHETKVNRTAVVVLPHADFAVFQIDNFAKNVSHDHPWIWGKGDGLNTFMIYEAAGDS